MIRKKLCLFYAILMIFFFYGLVNAEDEKLTITTYYPSPYGSYNELQINGKLAVGDVASDPKILGIDNLDPGQLYIGNSIVFKSLNSNPTTGNKAGQVIYNGPDKMLRFWNGSKWVNMTLTITTPPCPLGQSCKAPGPTYVGTYEDTRSCCIHPSICNPVCSTLGPPSCPPGSNTAYTRTVEMPPNGNIRHYYFVTVCVQ